MARRLTEEDQQRRTKVMELKRRGHSFEAIGAQLGISKQRAHQLYWDTLKKIPVQEVAEYRVEQAERLDEMLRRAYEVLERRHITVSNGRVIYHEDEPLADDGPTLQAIRTVLAIEEQRARLLGLNAPVKQELGGEVQVTYSFEGVDLGQLK
ncbi:hypothetical protein AB0C27_40595 [Nonomuraea sp. NPDC048882]|uniref:hypothetical protein n=1 Tax=Nonomuraea sp. NPDC048882 TaxID=3154347 RepID=UPI0033CD6F22